MIFIHLTSPDEISGLQRAYPHSRSLTVENAAIQIVSAKIAGMEYNISHYRLLYIAGRESDFTNAVTKEIGGKVSCGTMTAEPTLDKKKCDEVNSSALNGYRNGAAHIISWVDECKHNKVWKDKTRCALLGFAGGHPLQDKCRKGPVISYRKTGPVDLCDSARLTLIGEAYIKKMSTRKLSD